MFGNFSLLLQKLLRNEKNDFKNTTCIQFPNYRVFGKKRLAYYPEKYVDKKKNQI